MKLEINHYYPNSDPDIARRLGRIEQALYQLTGKVDEMAADFSGWEAELAGITDGVTAVEALIQKIVDELKAGSAADQGKIRDFTTQLTALKTRLATAAMAGTPADPNAP